MLTYMSRKEGRRGHANIKDSVDALIQWLEDYREKGGERLITDTKNNINNTMTNWTTITRKQK